MKKVNSIDELKKLVKKGVTDYCIYNGLFRSSKFINEGENKDFFILHLIDDSEEEVSAEELMDSNIGQAINNGCFFYD